MRTLSLTFSKPPEGSALRSFASCRAKCCPSDHVPLGLSSAHALSPIGAVLLVGLVELMVDKVTESMDINEVDGKFHTVCGRTA